MSRAVHVVVVAYGSPEETVRAVRAVAGVIECTVVDNSSNPWLQRQLDKFPVRYVDAGGNRGFAAGANIALRAVLRGPAVDVMLLNPDAVIQPDGVKALSAVLHAPGHDRVGAVAPRQVHPGSGREQSVLWPWPTPARAWAEAIGLRRLVWEPHFLIGAVLLLRWEALQDIGLFDERFFLYAEETDWQRRAALHGWSVLLADTVTATHVSGGTLDSDAVREMYFHAGSEIYIRKWFGTVGWQAFRAAHVVGALIRLPLRSRAARDELRRRLRLYAVGPSKQLARVRREQAA